jgi:Fur family transcriptional regulator, zinc uptake regulator
MTVEFSRRTQSLLARANEVCQQRGANLTSLRRQVLGLILDAASPTGAYELLDRLRLTERVNDFDTPGFGI